MVAADLNGDGTLDLAVTGSINDGLTLLANQGSGGFVPAGRYDTDYSATSAAAADFNGDGRLDLVIGDTTESILLNTCLP